MFQVAVTGLLCLFVHVGVNLIERFCDRLTKTNLAQLELLSVVTNGYFYFVICEVFCANFDSNRSAFNFPVVELETWIVVFSIVNLNSDTRSFKLFRKFVRFVHDLLAIVILEKNGNNNYLNLSYSWGEYDTCVVRVNHNHGADRSGRKTP